MSKKEHKHENREGKEQKEEKPRIIVNAFFTGEIIFSNKQEAFTLYEQSRFGEPKDGKIYYSFCEALYLVDKGRMILIERKKQISFEKLLRELRKHDIKIETKYPVFKDMRDRGYIVKTALKFGAEFRVYDKGIKPGENHAKWVLFPVRESDSLTWHDFSAKNRVAHSTRKNLLIGIVDDENEVTYYECIWTRP